MIQPHIRRVILYVQDIDAQVRFYRDMLGLSVAWPSCDSYAEQFWITFDTGDCVLALHGGGGRQFGDDAPKVCFFCDDIAAERTNLVSRGIRCGEIREAAPGVRVLDFRDPEGNRLALESHTDEPHSS